MFVHFSTPENFDLQSWWSTPAGCASAGVCIDASDYQINATLSTEADCQRPITGNVWVPATYSAHAWAHPTSTEDIPPVNGHSNSVAHVNLNDLWPRRAYHMGTSSYCMEISKAGTERCGGVFKRGDSSCDLENVEGTIREKHHEKYIEDPSVLGPKDRKKRTAVVPRNSTTGTPWPNCHYMRQSQGFTTLDGGKWWKEGFRVSVVPIASSGGTFWSALTEEAYPFMIVVLVLGALLIFGSLRMLFDACMVHHPYPTLGYFILRRYQEKRLLCRCCPKLFVSNIMALASILFVLLATLVLLAYKAAQGDPVPGHVLSVWALAILTIILQSSKLMQPHDEDMYADSALLGAAGVKSLAKSCDEIVLRMGLVDHFSLSSKDALKRVETAMMLEALSGVTIGKRARQAALDALEEVFATQKDVDAFRRMMLEMSRRGSVGERTEGV